MQKESVLAARAEATSVQRGLQYTGENERGKSCRGRGEGGALRCWGNFPATSQSSWMPKRTTDRKFGVAGTPSKWRAIGQSNQQGGLVARHAVATQDVLLPLGRGARGVDKDTRSAGIDLAATAGPGNAVMGGLCVDKENALTLNSRTDEELELEKLQSGPSSPGSSCIEMAAACEDGTEHDPLGLRRKRVEEVCGARFPPTPTHLILTLECRGSSLVLRSRVLWSSLLQLQDAESERRRRIARLQAVVMTLENLLIRPASDPPQTEDPVPNRRASSAEGGNGAAASSKRRRRLDSKALMVT